MKSAFWIKTRLCSRWSCQLSFCSVDPVLTCSCRGCCSLRRKTTTVNKFSGISFYLVCLGISVGGKGRCPPGKQTSSPSVRGRKTERHCCKPASFQPFSVLSLPSVLCFLLIVSSDSLFVLFSCFCSIQICPDVDPLGMALAAGVNFSSLVLSSLPSSSMFSYWEVTGTERLPLPPVINIAAFCQSRARHCQDMALLLAPEGLPLPGSLYQALRETRDKGVIARVECAVRQLMAASFEKRSIVGVWMTFRGHCCPLIEASLREAGRARWNILQLRLRVAARTPRAPGSGRDVHSVVMLVKDTAGSSFPLPSFRLSLLEVDKTQLFTDASI